MTSDEHFDWCDVGTCEVVATAPERLVRHSTRAVEVVPSVTLRASRTRAEWTEAQGPIELTLTTAGAFTPEHCTISARSCATTVPRTGSSTPCSAGPGPPRAPTGAQPTATSPDGGATAGTTSTPTDASFGSTPTASARPCATRASTPRPTAAHASTPAAGSATNPPTSRERADPPQPTPRTRKDSDDSLRLGRCP